VLAGGTGGAKLAAGFNAVLRPGELTVIANTADDDEFWGLLVCPDIDAVIYRLAGVFNDETGYGLMDESFQTLAALRALGEETWFHIGDRDLATHVLRTAAMKRGGTLSEATLELCRRFQLSSRVLPMCDQPVRTRCVTDRGTFSLQEYFVRENLAPRLLRIDLEGVAAARLPAPAVDALEGADVVVIGPSNPFVSIDPIVRVAGGRIPRAKTVAVSPLVGGTALKGPTVEMLRALGFEVSPVEIARRYRDVCSTFVLDEVDAALAPEVERLGLAVRVLPTVMDDGGRRLAAGLLAGAGAR
jgi:LPPG:FO 2-phospho-L-lactate transferase